VALIALEGGFYYIPRLILAKQTTKRKKNSMIFFSTKSKFLVIVKNN